MKSVYNAVKEFATNHPFFFIFFVLLTIATIHFCSGVDITTWMHKPVGTMDRGELLLIVALAVILFK